MNKYDKCLECKYLTMRLTIMPNKIAQKRDIIYGCEKSIKRECILNGYKYFEARE